MKRIAKRSPEPPLLLQERKSGARRWTDVSGRAKEQVRRALWEDQHGLCCYCMVKLEDAAFHETIAPRGVKIEHVIPQTDAHEGEALAVSWKNLVAACSGGHGQPFSEQTCDTHKGNQPFRELDPVRSEPLVGFTPDGRITSSSSQTRHDLGSEVLNLNVPRLRRWRQESYDALIAALERKFGSDRTWTRGQLDRYLSGLSLDTQFYGAHEFWLRQWIRVRT